jgi:sulfite exporter TauE/SafE
MIEWPLLVASGLLGSAHCLGMCGPFVLTIGSRAPRAAENVRRQAAWSAGRIFTYAVLGAGAAFLGSRLCTTLTGWVNVPAVLAVVAGVLLVIQGLAAAGVLPTRGVTGVASCPGASGFKALLEAQSLHEVFIAGVFTGLLPCGLLYGMLALAASSHDVLRGMGTMVAFGLGTVPALLLAGLGGSLLAATTRRHAYTIAAWCLVATGLVSIARGVGYISLGAEPAGCPLCAPGRSPD